MTDEGVGDFGGMVDLYEQWASEALAAANEQQSHEADWRDGYEEMASELLALARISREVGA